MTPVVNKFTNATLGAPRNWDEKTMGKCEGLPVCRQEPHFFSWWDTTWRERILILFGRPIRLAVVSTAHPPVHLDLVKD